MALGIDLRKRVVTVYEKKEGTALEITKQFCVSLSSLFRWVRRERAGEGLWAKRPTGRKTVVKEPEVLQALYKKQADLPQRKAAVLYQERTGVPISQKTVSRALQRLGQTRKKRHLSQRNKIRSG